MCVTIVMSNKILSRGAQLAQTCGMKKKKIEKRNNKITILLT